MKSGSAKRFATFFLVMFLALAPAISASGEAESFSARVDDFDKLFRPYQSTVGEVTRWMAYEPQFDKLASGGDSLIDESIAYLSEPGHTPLQRRIAILATCKTSLFGWIRFSNKILDMYQIHIVDADEVRDTVLPRHIYSHYAMDYFWKPDVRHILYRTYAIKEIDNLTKGEITDILTGWLAFSWWLSGPDP